MSNRISVLRRENARDKIALEEAQAKAARLTDAIATRNKVMMQHISMGESTGDRFLDFALMREGHLNEALATHYKKIHAALGNAARGELVLATHHGNWVVSLGSHPEYKPREFFCCGVLEGEMVLRKDSFFECFAEIQTTVCLDEAERPQKAKREDLSEVVPDSFPYPGYFALPGDDITKVLGYLVEEWKVRRLIIGDDAVREWLRVNRDNHGLWDQLNRMLRPKLAA